MSCFRKRQGTGDSFDKPRACPFRPAGRSCSRCFERGRPFLRFRKRQGTGDGFDKPRACPFRPAGRSRSRCFERGRPFLRIRYREACAKRARITLALLGFGGQTGHPEENQACSRQSKKHRTSPASPRTRSSVISMTDEPRLVGPPVIINFSKFRLTGGPGIEYP